MRDQHCLPRWSKKWLINTFTVNADEAPQLLKAWPADAAWMRQQPGFISTQLHRVIAGSCVFLNYAVWESTGHFKQAFIHPEFRSHVAHYPPSTRVSPHFGDRRPKKSPVVFTCGVSVLQGFRRTKAVLGGGRLFLDSVEQALAAALVDSHAVQRRSLRRYRGGLGPARLRTIKEFVQAKMEDDLTHYEMAQSVDLSPAHFSRMFRKSTGETPHQFVLRQRVERAKEMLRAPEARVLDVAVACGFKTQQHFARVFRHLCGTSPREYRLEWWSRDRSERHHSTNPQTELISLLQ